MEINYSISPYPSLTQNMVARLYETQSPLAEIDNRVIPTPHNNPVYISFTGLDKVPHIVMLFTASGTLLHQYDVQPSENVVTVFDPIFFKIGDGAIKTPAVGSTIYSNNDLASLTNIDLVISRDGRMQYPGIHYDVDILGGFHLLIAGDQFEQDVEWVIQRTPDAVVNPVNDSVVGKQFGGFLTVNNTVQHYVPAHLRKLIRLSGAAGEYYFDAGVDVPIGYVFRFVNFGPYGNVNDTANIFFNNAPLLWGNTTVSSFALPYKATAEFCFDGANWNCTMNTNISNSPAPFGKIVHMGRFNVGDVATQFSSIVTIPTQPDNNYWIVGSLVGLNANIDIDNDVFATFSQLTPTSFIFILREIQGFIQNLRFDYVIMRAN